MARSHPDLKVIAPAPRRRRAGAPVAATPPADSTRRIVEAITTAIVERRLMPGTKLAEQQIADIFKVSRTLVRQALNQLSRDHLVTLEPARGAFVAQPSVQEARQVFEVRAMIEAAMMRQLCARITDAAMRSASSSFGAPSKAAMVARVCAMRCSIPAGERSVISCS